MYIHGQFVNKKGNIITVEILSHNDRTDERVIGEEKHGIYFQEDPVEIDNEMNDTFDHLLRHSCTLHLLCRDFISDFYNTTCRDTVVNVRRDGIIVFAGYIEPLVFSQAYNQKYDEVELNCIDLLSALQYSRYMNVGAGISYAEATDTADQRSFLQILNDTIVSTAAHIIINSSASDNDTVHLYYDGSKQTDSKQDNPAAIFSQIAVSDFLFLEEDEEDVWKQDVVVEEVMRYLDLHILQDGITFYIYSWETLRMSGGNPIRWYDLAGGSSTLSQRRLVEITESIVADTETQIDIDEAYNKLVLKDNTKSMENLVSSPLDEEDLTSPFTNKQLYMKEYLVEGSDDDAKKLFNRLLNGAAVKDGHVNGWFIRIMDNSKWKFRTQTIHGADIYAADHPEDSDRDYFPYSGDNRCQHALPDALGTIRGAAILQTGEIDLTKDQKDYSVKDSPDMENCLVISVAGDNNQDDQHPTQAELRACIPYATYDSKTALGVFSPGDDDTVNYIVISGKVALNGTRPISTKSGSNVVKPVQSHKGERFYTYHTYKAETPGNIPEVNISRKYGAFVPFSDFSPANYPFQFASDWREYDDIEKLPVIMCMLVIGDKCLVEKGKGQTFTASDTPGTGRGDMKDYVWRPFRTREECADDREYYSQSFSIGINPKIGDYIVGTEFDIQNNIDPMRAVNIDAEGTAIPMRKSDRLHGKVHFEILCPAYPFFHYGQLVSIPVWEDLDLNHFPYVSEPVLATVGSIVLKDFEIKLYSDNGNYSTLEDKDIIYTSDTEESFVNVKDDIEFKITSGLTAAENYSLGVKSELYMSTPFNLETEEVLREVYDRNTQETAKPEQHYVSNHYDDCHVPRVTMTQNIEDEEDNVNLFYLYLHNAMGKAFWVTGISRNLMEGTAVLNLRSL